MFVSETDSGKDGGGGGMMFWYTSNQSESLSHKVGFSVIWHGTINSCDLGYGNSREIEWEYQLWNRPLKYTNNSNQLERTKWNKNEATHPRRRRILLVSSVINQLRVLYPLFRRTLPFFFGVLQVVLKIKLAFKEFGSSVKDKIHYFLYRRNGFVPTWAGFEPLHNIIQEAVRQIKDFNLI